MILITEKGKEIEAITRLARIGYENVIGYLNGGIDQWKKEKNITENIKNITVEEMAELMDTGKYALLDVRRPAEVEKNIVVEAHHIPLNALQSQMDVINSKNKYILYCAGGYRSMMACSILKREGIKNVINVQGGINAILKEKPELVQQRELV